MKQSAKQWGRQAAVWGYCAFEEYSTFLRGERNILMYYRVLQDGHDVTVDEALSTWRLGGQHRRAKR